MYSILSGQGRRLFKSVVGTNVLADLQHVIHTAKHDRIHAKSDCPIDARILTVALQHVADFRTADSGRWVNIGNRTARAGLNRFQLRHALRRAQAARRSSRYDVGGVNPPSVALIQLVW